MIMDEQTVSQRPSVVEANLAFSLTNHPMSTMSIEAQDDLCCNVYVANLPPTADAQAIRSVFETVGKVLHVKLLLDIASGVSRGISFVMFENIETARKACALKNKVVLGGNVLQVRLAERSSLHSSVNSHVRSSVVYIRNVPGTITHDMVKRFCEERFGPVVEVTPHPQSAELKGPSPFNMDFVVFKSVDHACLCVESVDGRATFPMPPNHPFTMAKMITDVAGEMRKSILLRRRSSDNQANRRGSGSSPKSTSLDTRRQSGAMYANPPPPPPPPSLPQHGFSSQHTQPHLAVNPQFQPFVQQPPFMTNFPQQQQPQQMMSMFPPTMHVSQSSSSPPMYEGQFNNNNVHNSQFLDTSNSHRSSLDTSMFQSQRGSLMMLNQPFGQMVGDSGPAMGMHSMPSPMQHQPQQSQQFYQQRLSQPQLMSQSVPLQQPPLHQMHQQFPHMMQQQQQPSMNQLPLYQSMGHPMNGREF